MRKVDPGLDYTTRNLSSYLMFLLGPLLTKGVDSRQVHGGAILPWK